MLIIPLGVVAAYLFKTLEARDGLTSSQVNCILKDSRGYMWFGTPAGLYRFDGYTFRNFQAKKGCMFLAEFMHAAGNPEHNYVEVECPDVLKDKY